MGDFDKQALVWPVSDSVFKCSNAEARLWPGLHLFLSTSILVDWQGGYAKFLWSGKGRLCWGFVGTREFKGLTGQGSDQVARIQLREQAPALVALVGSELAYEAEAEEEGAEEEEHGAAEPLRFVLAALDLEALGEDADEEHDDAEAEWDVAEVVDLHDVFSWVLRGGKTFLCGIVRLEGKLNEAWSAAGWIRRSRRGSL